MAARYIDANLIQYKDLPFSANDKVGVYVGYSSKSEIDEIPTADVQEVKHSYWEEVNTYECEFHSVTDMRCHNCGHFASLILPHKTKCTYDICPFCGAKMDGGNDK